MKRFISVKTAALLIFVALAAGCSSENNEKSSSVEGTVSSEFSSESSAGSTSKEEKSSEETSSSSIIEEPETVKISDITEPLGDTGLRVYLLPDGKDYYIVGVQGSLAIINGSDEKILSVDFATGKTAEKEIRVIDEDEWGRYGLSLVNGFPIEIDNYGGKLTVYDKSFRTISENTISEEGDIGSQIIGNYIMWKKSENILCYAKVEDDGSVNTGEIAVKLPEKMILSHCAGTINDKEWIVSYYSFDDIGSVYGILNRETGEVAPLNASENGYPYAIGGKILINVDKSTTAELFAPDNLSDKKVIELPEGAVLVDTNDNEKSIYYYTDLPSEKEGHRAFTIYRYSISDGKLVGTISEEILADEISAINVSECGEYAVIDAFVNNCSQLLFGKFR